MGSYIWPVVFFSLIGLVAGAATGYKMAHTMVNRTHVNIAIAAIVLCIPFTIYFSIEHVPLITQLAYLLPAFGISFVWVSSLVIQDHLSKDDDEHHLFMKKNRYKQEKTSAEMSLDDLLAEKARRDAARGFESHITELSDEELEEQIKAARKKN